MFADCPNLDQAVQAAVGSIFFNQGESCNAPSRLFVEASIKEQFLEKALALVPRYAPANPLDQATVMGAIVDQTQMNTVLRYIEKGKSEGARLLASGEQVLIETGGCYVQPTIFDGVRNDMTIAREEIFGPVLSVLSFTDAADVACDVKFHTKRHRALYLGILEVKSGAPLSNIGAAIQTHAGKHGYSVVRDFCGHGIGAAMHEEPEVRHFGKRGSGQMMLPGMTFTIEPMLNAGRQDVHVMPDGWTVVTKDHSPSAQWEHTVLVTNTGVEILTLRPSENERWNLFKSSHPR